MTPATTPLIFDGHNDVLLKLYSSTSPDPVADFVGGYHGHIDVPKSRLGGFGGGFFAIYVPSTDDIGDFYGAMRQPTYDLPLPRQIPHSTALSVAMSQANMLLRLQAAGALKICHSAADIRTCLKTGKLAAIMHMEGAEAIDTDFAALNVLHHAGLRSLGPVWSRPTAYGHGVPFRFPSTGDTGPGLTDAGKALIAECNRLKILVDLSHLNEAGFWDVARLSDAPLVATHSNAHALCHQSRNLTDRQLAAIKDSDGMVGVNFAVAFLRDDGQMLADTGIDQITRHLDYLMEHLGEDRVGFGSDFDGAMVPEKVGNAAGLGHLRTAMLERGYDAALMAKLCHGNWLRVLEKTWGG